MVPIEVASVGFFNGKSIECLNIASCTKEIESGFIYASSNFNKNFDRLKQVEKQLSKSDTGLKKQIKHFEFFKIFDLVNFYQAQADRLIKLWGKQTDSPIFLTGQNGIYIHMPTAIKNGLRVAPTDTETQSLARSNKTRIRACQGV